MLPQIIYATAPAHPLYSHACMLLLLLRAQTDAYVSHRLLHLIKPQMMLILLTTPTMQNMQMGGQLAVCLGHIFIC